MFRINEKPLGENYAVKSSNKTICLYEDSYKLSNIYYEVYQENTSIYSYTIKNITFSINKGPVTKLHNSKLLLGSSYYYST